MQLRLKRVESGLHQKTLGILLGGATQVLISWWESGRYMFGDRYLGRLNRFLGLDPLGSGLTLCPVGCNRREKVKSKTMNLERRQTTATQLRPLQKSVLDIRRKEACPREDLMAPRHLGRTLMKNNVPANPYWVHMLILNYLFRLI